jgi:hypothetical protein
VQVYPSKSNLYTYTTYYSYSKIYFFELTTKPAFIENQKLSVGSEESETWKAFQSNYKTRSRCYQLDQTTQLTLDTLIAKKPSVKKGSPIVV